DKAFRARSACTLRLKTIRLAAIPAAAVRPAGFSSRCRRLLQFSCRGIAGVSSPQYHTSVEVPMRIQVFTAVCLLSLTIPSTGVGDLGVDGTEGLVVCTSATACDAGASVLARAGNAVDAAVATAFALAVTHPSAGNIGGG